MLKRSISNILNDIIKSSVDFALIRKQTVGATLILHGNIYQNIISTRKKKTSPSKRRSIIISLVLYLLYDYYYYYDDESVWFSPRRPSNDSGQFLLRSFFFIFSFFFFLSHIDRYGNNNNSQLCGGGGGGWESRINTKLMMLRRCYRAVGLSHLYTEDIKKKKYIYASVFSFISRKSRWMKPPRHDARGEISTLPHSGLKYTRTV